MVEPRALSRVAAQAGVEKQTEHVVSDWAGYVAE